MMSYCKHCQIRKWEFYRKKGNKITMMCLGCKKKVTFNSEVTKEKRVKASDTQSLEDRRGEMLAKWRALNKK